MGRSRPRGSAGRMQQVRARIERWRQTRAKRSPMPEALWDAAVELAGSEGLYAVARGLQVNYQSLKARVADASVTSRRATARPQGFVELSAPLPLGAPPPVGPVVEFSDGQGAKLTIRLPAEGGVDVERLAVCWLRRGRR